MTFANKITVCRILAVPFFISAVLYYTSEHDYLRYIALGIFMFAVVSDVIDGYIARTRHQKTKAGAILDPLADKLLLISAFICLYRIGPQFGDIRLPMWFVVAVISRDISLLIGTMLIHLMHKELVIEPTIWGKASTFLQVLAVIGVLLQFKFSVVIWPIALIFIVISGVDYIRKGIKILNEGAGK